MSVKLSFPPIPLDAIPVTLDVGGKHYRTTTSTLKTMPSTRLGKIAQEAEKNNAKSVDLFVDRNPQIVNSLLDLYRTGKLHLPHHMCVAAANEELQFWQVPRELLEDCCWKRLEGQEEDEAVVAEINRFLEDPYAKVTTTTTTITTMSALMTWRLKIWTVMEGLDCSLAEKVWGVVFCLFILLSVLTSAFETIFTFRTITTAFTEVFPATVGWSPQEAGQHLELKPIDVIAISVPDTWLLSLRYITFAFFLGDLLIRLAVCPARSRFFRQARNWLEVFIGAQSCALYVMENEVIPEKIRHQSVTSIDRGVHAVLMALAAIRAFRVFYMAKNFDYMQVLLLCAKSSFKEMLMLIVCVLSFITLFGTLAYTSEVLAGLTTFYSIPSGMWWALVTMTTVGYGDVYPVSVGGKLVGSLCALSGLIVMAMPIAVIASKFSLYHSNLFPREQSKARAAFVKDNPEFDLAHHGGKGQDKGEGEVRGHSGRRRVGAEGGRKWKSGCWGASSCKVDTVSLPGVVTK